MGWLSNLKNAMPFAGALSARGARAGGFDAASSRTPDLARWAPPPLSGDAALLGDLPAIVGRTQDLARNSGVAVSGREVLLDNVLGTGLRVKPRPAYRLLGRDFDWQEIWSRDVALRFGLWAGTRECDVAQELPLSALSQLAFRSWLDAGEAVALVHWKPERANGTALQLVDASRLEAPPSLQFDPARRAGIERDGNGAALAYWIRRRHPNDGIYAFASAFGADHERVPARTPAGRRRVLHVYERERIGQSRGVPAMTAVLREVKSLDRYKTSELQAAVVNAMVAAFIETPLDPTLAGEILGIAADGGANDYMDRMGSTRLQLQGGTIPVLPPGTKMSAFLPARPAAAFGAFTEAALRQIAAGLNLPYELLLKDFSKTNYSSARAALLETWRYFVRRRSWWAREWYQEIYELWLEAEIDAGRIDAPDFYANRAAWTAARWIGDGRGWIDPVKEASAAQMRMDSQLSTLETESAEQGGDWRENLEQLARENAYRKELGLPDPQSTAVVATAPIAPDEDPNADSAGRDTAAEEEKT